MKPTDFSYQLSVYLSKHLPSRIGVSSNTVKSYRDTFSLLLRFCLKVKKIPIKKITIVTLEKSLIEEFLTWIETERGCCVSTRNQRLAAIHAFFKYLQMETPEYIYLCQQILAIPIKKTHHKTVVTLTLHNG